MSPLRFAAETFLEDALEAQPDLLGVDVLIIGRQVELACGGKVDLLAIDRNGTLLAIEAKRDAAAAKAFGQVLGYAYQIATMTYEEIARQCARYLGVPLPIAFAERFGTELPETINVRQLPVLVAPAFNRGAVDVTNLLRGGGVSLLTVKVTGYDIAGSTILASSFERGDASLEARTALSQLNDADHDLRATTVWGLTKFQQTVVRFLTSLERLPRPEVVPLPSLKSIPGVHFDIIGFLVQYVPQFRWKFVPYSLLKLLYGHWAREQASCGVLRYSSTDIHFPRQLKKGMKLIGGWEWDALLAERARPLMSGNEPLADLVGWKKPLTSPRITGYRQVDVGGATG